MKIAIHIIHIKHLIFLWIFASFICHRNKLHFTITHLLLVCWFTFGICQSFVYHAQSKQGNDLIYCTLITYLLYCFTDRKTIQMMDVFPHPLDSSYWRWSDRADNAGSCAPPPAPQCASAAKHFSPGQRTGELAGLKPGWRGCTEGEEAPVPQVLQKEGRWGVEGNGREEEERRRKEKKWVSNKGEERREMRGHGDE